MCSFVEKEQKNLEHDDLDLSHEFYFQWHITEKCNLRCKHCYHVTYDSNNELTLPDLYTVCDKIDDALIKWQKQGSLSITGGEPFLRKEDMYGLLDYIETKPTILYYDILSNGSLLESRDFQKLCDYKKLRRFQLSLEGSSPDVNDKIRGKGSFNKSIEKIRELKRHGIEVSVMMTISRVNSGEIFPLIDLLTDLRVDNFSMERFIPEGSGDNLRDDVLTTDELRDVFESVHKLAIAKKDKPRILLYRPLFGLTDADDPTVGAMCSVGTNALTIMQDGTVYPCRRLPIPIGNILSDGIYKIWYSSDLLWKFRDQSNLQGKCNNCDYIPICRGCRAMAYFSTGNFLAEDPQCWKSDKMIPLS